jgi:hypothetical protein
MSVLTVGDLVRAKQLPEDFLRGLGLRDTPGGVAIHIATSTATCLSSASACRSMAKGASYNPLASPSPHTAWIAQSHARAWIPNSRRRRVRLLESMARRVSRLGAARPGSCASAAS